MCASCSRSCILCCFIYSEVSLPIHRGNISRHSRSAHCWNTWRTSFWWIVIFLKRSQMYVSQKCFVTYDHLNCLGLLLGLDYTTILTIDHSSFMLVTVTFSCPHTSRTPDQRPAFPDHPKSGVVFTQKRRHLSTRKKKQSIADFGMILFTIFSHRKGEISWVWTKHLCQKLEKNHEKPWEIASCSA